MLHLPTEKPGELLSTRAKVLFDLQAWQRAQNPTVHAREGVVNRPTSATEEIFYCPRARRCCC